MTRFSGPTRRQILQGGAGVLAAGAMSDPRCALAADKTLTIAIPNNPGTFDPMNQVNHDAMVGTQTVFENLLEVDVDGVLRPSLAVSLPKISDDKLTYWFDLRDDVRFQNGDRFTAEDVKYSYEYIIDPKNKAVRRNLWTPIREITVESPTRVRFEMRMPYRPWLDYMSKFMGIFPKGSRERFGSDYFRLTPIGVGTGPGIFVEWRQNDYVEFRRNPDYWRKGVPAWDRLVMKTVPEDSVRVAYLLTNQAQIVSAPSPKEFLRLKSSPGITGASKPGLGCSFFMQLNARKPPFDDVNFRKAIAFGIDRKLLAKDVYYGMLDASSVPAPPDSWWFSKEAADTITYDPEKARAFLAKSKYPRGAEFELLVPAQPYLIDVRDAAVVVQSQLAELGIRANIRLLEAVQVITQNISGAHTASLFPNMGPSDPTYLIQAFYAPDQVQSKSSGYTNEQLTALIKQSFAETEQDKLKPIYAKMQAILAEDSPGVWLGFVHIANLWRNEVKGFRVNTGLTMRVRDVDLA